MAGLGGGRGSKFLGARRTAGGAWMGNQGTAVHITPPVICGFIMFHPTATMVNIGGVYGLNAEILFDFLPSKGVY